MKSYLDRIDPGSTEAEPETPLRDAVLLGLHLFFSSAYHEEPVQERIVVFSVDNFFYQGAL